MPESSPPSEPNPKTNARRNERKLREVLQRARVGRGLTQAQLAERLNRPQSFVSKYESGDRRLTVGDFLQISAALPDDPGRLLRELGDGRGTTILEEWDVTPEELSDVVRENPSLRGITLGYVAEMKLRKIIAAWEGATFFTKFDDHDRKRKGDLYVVYRDRAFDIEAKSLQTASVSYDQENDLWTGRAQVDGSDRRELTFRDGTKLTTTLLRRGDFDVLAVNCFAFGLGWRFVFCRNSDLPRSSSRRYSEAQRERLIKSWVDVSWPPTEPFGADLRALLDRMVENGEGADPEAVLGEAEVVSRDPAEITDPGGATSSPA